MTEKQKNTYIAKIKTSLQKAFLENKFIQSLVTNFEVVSIYSTLHIFKKPLQTQS